MRFLLITKHYPCISNWNSAPKYLNLLTPPHISNSNTVFVHPSSSYTERTKARPCWRYEEFSCWSEHFGCGSWSAKPPRSCNKSSEMWLPIHRSVLVEGNSFSHIYIYIYFAALHEMGIKGASFSLSFFFSSLYFLKVVSTIFSKEFSQMFFFFPFFWKWWCWCFSLLCMRWALKTLLFFPLHFEGGINNICKEVFSIFFCSSWDGYWSNSF